MINTSINFRVNYSPTNWERLSKSLQDDLTKIHRINRAQIIKDSLSLARANMLPYKIALDTTKYLNKELEYIPWAPAIAELTYIGQMLGQSERFDNFKDYMFKQLSTLFNKLGLKAKESDGVMEKILQSLVAKTLCKLNYEPCIKSAVEMYEMRKKCKYHKKFEDEGIISILTGITLA